MAVRVFVEDLIAWLFLALFDDTLPASLFPSLGRYLDADFVGSFRGFGRPSGAPHGPQSPVSSTRLYRTMKRKTEK